jgi:hypothetical protein
MNKIIFTTIFLFSIAITFAQNSDPYKIFGYTSKVKYEVRATDWLYITNKDTTSNIKAIAFNMDKSEAQLIGKNDSVIQTIIIPADKVLRWLSVDPLSAKYPQWSPYNAMLNNPIKYIDPDGREVIIAGEDAKKAAKQLGNSSSLKIKFDEKTGQLSATGKAKTDYDKALLSAINDKDVIMTLNTTRTNQTANGNELYVGAFEGNKKGEDGKVNALATINMSHVEKAATLYGSTQGSYVGHEIIESFTAGKESPNTPAPTMDPNSKGYNEYLSAHNKALAADPSFIAPNVFKTADLKTIGLEKYFPGTKVVVGEVILYTK